MVWSLSGWTLHSREVKILLISRLQRVHDVIIGVRCKHVAVFCTPHLLVSFALFSFLPPPPAFLQLLMPYAALHSLLFLPSIGWRWVPKVWLSEWGPEICVRYRGGKIESDNLSTHPINLSVCNTTSEAKSFNHESKDSNTCRKKL